MRATRGYGRRGRGRSRGGLRLDADRPAVSPDGTAVVFGSLARLTRADTDTSTDVYRYGVHSRRTTLVSGAPGIGTCAPEPAASRRGRFVAFGCDLAVLVHDHRRGVTRIVAPSGERPLISAGGGRIGFQAVDPLLPGGSPSGTEVYTVRRAGGALARVARAPGGGHPGGHVLLSGLSGDGRWIAFSATSTQLGFARVSPWGDVFVSRPWP